MTQNNENGKKSISQLLKRKKAVTIICALFLVGLFVVFGISTVNQRADISRLEQQKAEISAKYEEQTKENKELQAVLDSENKDDYIEKKAREKGYVKSDEVVFYDISASE